MAREDCPDVVPITTIDEGDAEGISEEVADSTTEPTPRQRALGKIKTVMDAGAYQDLPAEITRQALTPFSQFSDREYSQTGEEWRNYQTTLEDRFRFEARSFWGRQELFTRGDRDTETGAFTNINRQAFDRDNREVDVSGVPFRVMRVGREEQDTREEVSDAFLGDFYKKQTLWIQARQELFSRLTQGQKQFVQQWWALWTAGGTIDALTLEAVVTGDNRTIDPLFDTTNTFLDHVFRITAPMLPEEMAELNGLPKPAVTDSDMEYNFYIKEYETALSRIVSSAQSLEPLLPNMYAFLLENKSKNLDEDQSIFQQLITLNGIIKDVSRDILRGDGDNLVKVGESDTGEYFDKWGRAYGQLSTNLVLNQNNVRSLLEQYKRIIFSPQDLEIFKDFNDKKTLFPMYLDMEFSTDRTTILADAIKEAQLSTSMIRAAMEDPRENEEDPAYRPNLLNFRIATELITNGQGIDKIVEVADPQQRMVLDVTAWWNSVRNREFESTKPNVVLGTSLPEIFVSEDPQYRFVQTILSLIFSGKIRHTLNGRLRSFEDIMNGKHAYSETVFYKISKHAINSATGEPFANPIQDFFVPNSSELDIFRFIDTQLTFGKPYKYIVYAYEMVFGTAYEYRENSLAPDVVINDNAMIDVYTRPSIQLIETPLIEVDTEVADKPPLQPQIDIIPYRAVNDRVLINFMAGTGELREQPIAFSPEEQQKFNELRRLHGLGENDPVEFKGDDPIDFFEIYRITSEPKSYQDFAGRLHKEVDTEILEQNGKTVSIDALSSASALDFVKTNVKYYYTFRAVDVRGNVSNPSAIYKFELVDDAGTIYPVIEIFDLNAKNSEETKKSFKKYIQIGSAPIQTEVNITNLLDIESAEDAEVELGIAEEKLFDNYPNKKKIKLRLTSKDTGKKIDINLNFTHRHTS